MSRSALVFGKLFYFENCIDCGTEHAFEEHIYKALQDRKGHLECFCPNGHSWVYSKGKTRAQKLEEEISRLRQQAAYKDDRIKEERDNREAAERSARAYKGQTTRLRNRAKAGLCPCCNRTFENLQRHIKTKHPEFQAEDEKAA